jgi:hypothetical protein
MPLLSAHPSPLGSKPFNATSSNPGQASQPPQSAKQHIAPSKATTKGHLDQTQKNVWSTKKSTKKATSHNIDLDLDAIPVQDPDNQKAKFFLPPSSTLDKSTPTKLVASPSPLAKATNIFLSSMTTT